MHTFRRFSSQLCVRYPRRVVKHPVVVKRCMLSTEKPSDMLAMQSAKIPKGILGQPTCHTHPHMIPNGQLTCGITQQEYKERRDNLVAKLLEESQHIHKSHIIIIPAACKQYMSDKIPYVFRQNSDFFYLTGCLEPSAILVMVKPVLDDSYKSILFVHEKDSHAELWEGPRTGCSLAATLFGVDEARPVENFNNFIHRIVSSYKPGVVWYQNESPPNPEIHDSIRSALRISHVSMDEPQTSLHQLRVVKSPAEVELMKETCYIGSQSVNLAMACTKPGSQRWLYNSDISRTWPVSGKFSKHHRILYELVLTVQKRLIELLREQRPPLDQLFDHMCRLLGTHLQQEGILPKNIDSNDLIGKAYRLCPHHVSHYLGLDVHDAPLVRRRVPVRTGMIVTVEPGIYIRPDDKSVPPEFRGVGIRIEDDVLITDSDPLILTDSCVREVDDIEAIVGKQSI
ncbi:xaa-Pro aminopeptidase 3-like isoform X2 [Maniola jurtina]|uniref:xaa-Pro aminopeptidase 3-like isoform X2 n=1 Tax=Maniola jurtina TaxID=191418 RepID=UPI001E6896B4|nr:xaa-Pro aminopeptidase 3-like isoform X2 [Maniola jurtina]